MISSSLLIFIDIFSFSNDKPYRIEFFGDEIESIRTFDIETQLSIGSPTNIQIVPNIEQTSKADGCTAVLASSPIWRVANALVVVPGPEERLAAVTRSVLSSIVTHLFNFQWKCSSGSHRQRDACADPHTVLLCWLQSDGAPTYVVVASSRNGGQDHDLGCRRAHLPSEGKRPIHTQLPPCLEHLCLEILSPCHRTALCVAGLRREGTTVDRGSEE